MKIEKFSEYHLTAMAHVLQITPHQVLKMNLEKVGPILFKCIKVEDDDPKPHAKRILLSLKIFHHFIVDKSEYVLRHLQSLMGNLLKLTKFRASLEVRIMACKCLEDLTKFPLFTLVPFKNDVTHDLTIELDDHSGWSRLVWLGICWARTKKAPSKLFKTFRIQGHSLRCFVRMTLINKN